MTLITCLNSLSPVIPVAAHAVEQVEKDITPFNADLAGVYTLTGHHTGNGYVTVDPQKDLYDPGETITLTAFPAPGWEFSGWTGDLISTDNPETITMDSDKDITANFTEKPGLYTLTGHLNGEGSVTINPVKTLYYQDEPVTLTAVADPGWEFTGWSGDLSGTDNPTSLIMDENKDITANFAELPGYTLTGHHTGNGYVTVDPQKVVYDPGETVTLTAFPAPGWEFSGWTGDLISSNNPETITMDNDKDITANFTEKPGLYTLTGSRNGEGYVTVDPVKTLYYQDEPVTLTAVAGPDWVFTGWSGDLVSTNNPETIIMSSNKDITANFAPDTYTLTYTAGSGGTITGTSPQTISYGEDGTEVVAVPNTGYHFVGWSDGVLTAARTDTNVTADLTVTANFAINTYTLTYNAGAGGTITGTTPQTVNHGADGTTVTAVPSTGYSFTGWSDGVLTAARTDTNVTADLTVTANFTINTYTLTYNAGPGGTITGTTPQTVSHGASGTTVTAVPSTGYHFVDWSDGVLTAARTDTNVTADLTVTANFAINTYTLTYTAGPGGTITGTSPQTVSYGEDGTEVVAVPSTGYHFVDWSDGVLTAARTDTNVTADLTVTANFTQDEYTINVTKVGNGNVTANVAGPYHYGDEVKLTATPDAGWKFDDWSGDLTGTANPATIVMDGNKAVTATFSEKPLIYALDITVVGDGTVTPNPDKPLYYDGEVVTLTADPDTAWRFDAWSGDLTGSTNPGTIVMDDNKAVTGTFELIQPPKVTVVNTLAQTADGRLTEGEVTEVAITQFMVTFDEAVKDPAGDTDPDDVTNPANYQLVNLGADGVYGGGDDTALAINAVSYASLTATLSVNNGTALPIGKYALVVKGTTSIVDLEGNPLDGNGDGIGGDNFVLTFTVDIPPAKPVLITPENQEQFNNPTPELAWNAALNAVSYKVQVDDNADFSSPIEDVSAVAGLTHTTAALAEGRYYWRVQGVNELNTAGAWSDAWYFTLDTTAPDVPLLDSPADGTISRGTPIYKWKLADGADLYQFRYTTSDDTTFASPVYTSPDLMVLSYQPPTQAVGNYLWQVRAGDAAGNWSDWSAYRAIVINPVFPTAPIMVSPANKLYTMDNTPTFVWEEVENAATYDLQISANKKFTDVSQIELNIAGLNYTLTDPLPDGKYYWRVRGVNDVLETGPWSAIWYFTVDTTKPDAPQLKSPSDPSRKTDTTPSFSWKSVAGAKTYQLEILDADLVPVLSTDYRANTKYTVLATEALAFGRYYWHVRAQDLAGNVSDWSEAWQLDISPLKSPAEGAFITDTTPQMSWFSVPNATAYRVQISTEGADPAFDGGTVVDTGVLPAGQTAYTLTEAQALDAGLYYWRLQAETAALGWSVYGPYGQFTVASVPPRVVLNTPANKTLTNDNTPTLSWNAVDWDGLAGEVEIQVDDSKTFSTPEQELTQDAGTSIETGALPDGRYYWRARAVNNLGSAGAWSAAWYFIVDATDPDVPEALRPVEGEQTSDTTPTFRWKKSAGAKWYVLELRDPGGALIWTSPQTTASALTLPAANALAYDADEYIWRIKAVDRAGNESDWSADNLFLESYLLWPIDGAYITDTTPTLKWKAVPGAEEYELNLRREDEGDNIIAIPAGATSYTAPTLDAYEYAWTMRVKVGGIWQEWMLEDHFFVEQPLPKVTLSAPASPALTQDTTPTFEWQAVVWQGAADGWYQIQVANNGRFRTTLIDEEVLAANMYTPAAGLADGRYYWRVRAVKDGENYGPWSDRWLITIDTTAPDAPVPLKPNLGGFQSSISYKFQWSKASGAVEYQLESQGRPAEPWQTSRSLLVPEIEYERVTWHVRAKDAAGNVSDWSEWVYSDVTIMKSPTDQSYLLNGQVPFKWTALASGRREQAQSYWLLVATDAAMTDLVFQKEFGPFDTGHTLAAADALEQGTYYWRYDACKDAAGCALADMTDPDWEGMQPWELVVSPALTKTIPWYPAHNITTNDSTPTFAWFTMAWSGYPGTYEIQISTNSRFKTLAHEADGIDQTSYTAPDLPDGRYYWRVRAVNSLGYIGPWSATQRLTIDAR